MQDCKGTPIWYELMTKNPDGAQVIYLMRGDSDEASQALARTMPDHCRWYELVTSDQKAALELYGKLFE